MRNSSIKDPEIRFKTVQTGRECEEGGAGAGSSGAYKGKTQNSSVSHEAQSGARMQPDLSPVQAQQCRWVKQTCFGG